MEKMICKLIKLIISLYILSWMASFVPELGGIVGLNGAVGIFLGVFYVKDPAGRYHYGWSGRFVSREEGFILTCILPLIAVGVPAISILTFPLYAMEQLLTATVGAEIVGLVGGMFTT